MLGVYDDDEQEYQSCCKAGTGFSDEDLKTHFAFFQNHQSEAKPLEYDVSEKLEPDVWFEPVQVWECKAADLQISPVHTAAKGVKADGKGIGLRFPRFLRIREDKRPDQATASTQIVDMFESQQGQQNATGNDLDDDY